MQEAKKISLNEVVSKILTNRGTYDFYMPLQTIFACFIFIRFFITTSIRVVSKPGNDWGPDDSFMPRLLNIISDWKKIQLNDPDSLLIIKRQLKIIPDLLKEIDIPDSLSSYGLDDTFVEEGCRMMQQKVYDIKQYTLDNMLVCENRRYRDLNPYVNFITDKTNSDAFKQAYRDNANKHYPNELQKLSERL